ncbi:MAG TPA: HAD-IIA family hydrolase [Bacillota bacterium]|nr:HAD-IIA family hydrolase [Bacillota bacterium]
MKAYVFDLDGTVYLGNTLLPGAKEAIGKIREEGKRLLFLSNNPLRTRGDYVQKLAGLGISIVEAEILNSAYVLCQHLRKIEPGAVVYPIGEAALKLELQEHGFTISEDPEKIRYVIASFDRTFAYPKLQIALAAIKQGAHFIATNPDRTCPVEDGELPDAGAVIGAIEGMTGKKVEWVAGKPSRIMAEAVVKHLDLEPEEILMVGDRLQTDIAMGKHGFKTALVLSGVTQESDLKTSPYRPDYCLAGIWELKPE